MFVKRLALGGFFNWDNIFVMCYVFPLVVRSMQKWPKKVHMFHPRHARQKIVGLR
jgi:hypothetical protein